MSDLTDAWRCYLSGSVGLVYDLLLIVVRCNPVGVNEVKMSTGQKRLRPQIYCLCASVLLKTGLQDYTQHFKNERIKYNTWVWKTSSEQKALFSVAKLSCLLTCWVYPALYLAVEKAPPVAIQLLIDSKKTCGFIRIIELLGVTLQNWSNCRALSNRWPGNRAR